MLTSCRLHVRRKLLTCSQFHAKLEWCVVLMCCWYWSYRTDLLGARKLAKRSSYAEGLSSPSGWSCLELFACSQELPRLLGSAGGMRILLVQARLSWGRMKEAIVLAAREESVPSPLWLSCFQLERCFQTPFSSWCPQGLAGELML